MQSQATEIDTSDQESIQDQKHTISKYMKVYEKETKTELKHESSILQTVATAVLNEGNNECSVCLEKLIFESTNAVLGCTHVFCAPCLNNWIANRTDENSVKCPMCRHKTSVVEETNPTKQVGSRVTPVQFPPVNTQQTHENRDGNLEIIFGFSRGDNNMTNFQRAALHSLLHTLTGGDPISRANNWRRYTRNENNQHPEPDDSEDDMDTDNEDSDQDSESGPDMYGFADESLVQYLQNITTQRMNFRSGRPYQEWLNNHNNNNNRPQQPAQPNTTQNVTFSVHYVHASTPQTAQGNVQRVYRHPSRRISTQNNGGIPRRTTNNQNRSIAHIVPQQNSNPQHPLN